MRRPLDGVRVLDWAAYHNGTHGAALLGDLGAEVIKIEERTMGDPTRGVVKLMGVPVTTADGRPLFFEGMNRNKKSVTVDLKKERGREVVYRLVEKSDVFLTNFRPQAYHKLGMDYQTLRQYNPKLIWISSNTLGVKGPDAGNPGIDTTGQARSGIMFHQRDHDDIPFSPGGLGDQMGSISCAYGVMAALLARERYGVGQELHTSILGSMMWVQMTNIMVKLFTGKEFPPPNREKPVNPMWGLYKCADGKWLSIAMGARSELYWPDFCKALDMSELENDPRFNSLEKKEENSQELVKILDRIFAQRNREEWLKALKEWDLLAAPVNTIEEAVNDPQVLENEYVVDYDHPVYGPLKLVNCPISFSETPPDVRGPAPELGQHTEEVLLDLAGYSWDEIAELKELEVV